MTRSWPALASVAARVPVRGRLAAAGALLAGGGFLFGVPAQQVRLADLAAALAVGFAALAGLAKQASP